jgi:hypothetical protein
MSKKSNKDDALQYSKSSHRDDILSRDLNSRLGDETLQVQSGVHNQEPEFNIKILKKSQTLKRASPGLKIRKQSSSLKKSGSPNRRREQA